MSSGNSSAMVEEYRKGWKFLHEIKKIIKLRISNVHRSGQHPVVTFIFELLLQ